MGIVFIFQQRINQSKRRKSMEIFFSIIVTISVVVSLISVFQVIKTGLATRASEHTFKTFMAHRHAVYVYEISVAVLVVLIEVSVVVLGASNRDDFFLFHIKLAAFFVVMIALTHFFNGFRFSYHGVLAAITITTYILGVAPTGAILVLRRVQSFRPFFDQLILNYF
jgi:hypothetical protein